MMRERTRRAIDVRVARASARLAEIAAGELPDDRVTDTGAGIAIAGAASARRLAFDARLRGLGALLDGMRR